MGSSVEFAVGYVGFSDVSVAGLELLQDAGAIHGAVSEIVGKCGKENGVGAIGSIHCAELVEILAKEDVGLGFGELNSALVFVAGPHTVTVTNVRPIFGFVEGLVFLDERDRCFVMRT